jgi:hypothetical protein
LNAYKNYLISKIKEDKISVSDRKELYTFRTSQKISDGEHALMLKKLGWTVEGTSPLPSPPLLPSPLLSPLLSSLSSLVLTQFLEYEGGAKTKKRKRSSK